MDVRVLTGLVCPAARPPARPPARPLGVRQYPGALKGCGVKMPQLTTLELGGSDVQIQEGSDWYCERYREDTILSRDNKWSDRDKVKPV